MQNLQHGHTRPYTHLQATSILKVQCTQFSSPLENSATTRARAVRQLDSNNSRDWKKRTAAGDMAASMAEKTVTRKRPVSLITGVDCSDSSEDSNTQSDSDTNSSCSVADDKRRYCFLKRAARQMVMVRYLSGLVT